jgi:hypothetical protein
MKKQETPTEESLAIVRERERQKTKRYMMFLGVIAGLAITGLFIVFQNDGSGGKRHVDIDIAKGKLSFSVEQPILQQVNQPTVKYEGGEKGVDFTTGVLSSDAFREIEAELPQTEPYGFAGKNYVNKYAGYLLTVNHPEIWQVAFLSFSNPYTNGATYMKVILSGSYLILLRPTIMPPFRIHRRLMT